jgi:hypothetical protein
MDKTKKNQYPPSLEEKPEVDRPPVAKAAPGWQNWLRGEVLQK